MSSIYRMIGSFVLCYLLLVFEKVFVEKKRASSAHQAMASIVLFSLIYSCLNYFFSDVKVLTYESIPQAKELLDQRPEKSLKFSLPAVQVGKSERSIDSYAVELIAQTRYFEIILSKNQYDFGTLLVKPFRHVNSLEEVSTEEFEEIKLVLQELTTALKAILRPSSIHYQWQFSLTHNLTSEPTDHFLIYIIPKHSALMTCKNQQLHDDAIQNKFISELRATLPIDISS